MANIVFGLVFLVIGLVWLIFNKFVTQWHIEFQNLFFGWNFSDRDRKACRFFFILGGIISTIIGALVLLSALSFI